MKPKSLNDFKEISVKSYKELYIGQKLYSDTEEITILSDVYYIPNTNGLWVDVEIKYEDGFTFKENFSLADLNITNGGYNPWMVFENKDIAILHKNSNWIADYDEFGGIIWMEATLGEQLDKDFMLSNFPIRCDNHLIISFFCV